MSKILFIGNTAWSMYNFRRVVFSRLISIGYSITIISPEDFVFQEKLRELGCNCLSLNISAKGINPLNDIKLASRIRVIIHKVKPDFCFFYTIKPNIYGSIVVGAMHIPHIAVTTGLGYIFLNTNIISFIAKRLYKFAFKNPLEVWFLNEDDKDSFLQANLLKERKAFVLKGEGVDLNHFSYSMERNTTVSFILIGRMLWDKGVKEYVEAAKELKRIYPNVKFKLLGFIGIDNPSAISKIQIEMWIKEGIVEYLGTTDDVRPFIEESSCVVLPSFYREGVPLSLLEGAAMGKPLIATNAIGCKETINDGITGFLCKPKDSKDLALAMKKIILMSHEERVFMGMAGRKKMENEFDVNLVVKQYLRTLNKYLT
ncbi:N N'-diacetylbacillosaminyl-diphospho-undecaprenol alpha-1 3-N-acetylgalactosaminyltransferase [termite gut metagenome]|uniref:N N'-diacetylbacillosaminyl-diphospho-undecaprenol alpha-1 3-N-acetylgalactosaminyltransferase n=1 Tax=termite gut metagenome TaxID=433724 RepID=A0A5J4SVV9_9ZZZZ